MIAHARHVKGIDVSETSPLKRYTAELVGTMVLVLMGCGSAVIAGRSFSDLSGDGTVGIALAFGLAVLVMVYAIGSISGCHINPPRAPTSSTEAYIFHLKVSCLWSKRRLDDLNTEVQDGIGLFGLKRKRPLTRKAGHEAPSRPRIALNLSNQAHRAPCPRLRALF